MTPHRIAPEAIADLDDIVASIALRGGTLRTAERIARAITERFYLLAEHPLMGRSRADLGQDRRSYSVGDYVIIYRVDRGTVQILRIVHGRRDIQRLFD